MGHAGSHLTPYPGRGKSTRSCTQTPAPCQTRCGRQELHALHLPSHLVHHSGGSPLAVLREPQGAQFTSLISLIFGHQRNASSGSKKVRARPKIVGVDYHPVSTGLRPSFQGKASARGIFTAIGSGTSNLSAVAASGSTLTIAGYLDGVFAGAVGVKGSSGCSSPASSVANQGPLLVMWHASWKSWPAPFNPLL